MLVPFQSEKLDAEEKYSNLNEEVMAVTRKIKKVQSTLASLKEELKDICHENHREQEGLLENIRQLTKELSYLEAIEKYYIPEDYRVKSFSFSSQLDDIIMMYDIESPSGTKK